MNKQNPIILQYMIYGIVGIPLAFGALPLYMLIPKFYAEFTGISLGLLGGILSFIRLFDAITDPWFGKLATQFNKRLIITFSLIIFSIMFYALTHPPQNNQIVTLVWFTITLLLTSISFSSASISYMAWGALLGRNHHQRSYFILSRESLTLISVIFAAIFPTIVSDSLPEGLHYLAIALLVLLLLAILLLFSFPNFKNQSPQPISHHSIFKQFTILWGVSSCRWLLIIVLINGIASSIPATLFFFFVDDVLNAKSLSGVFLAVYFLSGILFSPLWIKLSHHYQTLFIWKVAILISIVSFILSGLLSSQDIILFIIICVISGSALGADLCLPSTIAANLGEKYQLSGTLFAWWNLVIKLSLALAGGIALMSLNFTGYQLNAGNENSFSLKIAYVFIPIAIKLIVIGLITHRNKYESDFITHHKEYTK